ncbi:hypothetical protein N665_0218s0084 [Sinapis alba]|nr:hypothetical protein N665_0218s0084 [Sinapis alba]
MFLGTRDDPSSSTSGTASAPEFVLECQSQGRSLQMTQCYMPSPPPLPMYVPPALYVPHALYVPPSQQPQSPPPDAAPAPEAAPSPNAAPGGIHLDLMVPPDAPYARFTVKDLLPLPGREGLCIIDPYGRPKPY